MRQESPERGNGFVSSEGMFYLKEKIPGLSVSGEDRPHGVVAVEHETAVFYVAFSSPLHRGANI